MDIRSFLAFELPPETRRVLNRVAAEVHSSPLDGKWVRTGNIHLTVIFLGNIREEELAVMGEAVGRVCALYAPFPIRIKPMGCFPHKRNPRVLWLGLETDLDRMARFRDTMQERLLPFGIKAEKRPFRPHLTLGRFRKAKRADPRVDDLLSFYKDLTSPPGSLNELVLFKSDLKPAGAVYTKMLSWPLSEKRQGKSAPCADKSPRGWGIHGNTPK